MGFDANCNTGLVLGLGFNDHNHQEKKKKSINKVIPLKSDHQYLFPSDLTLGPSSEEIITCWSASAPGKINDLPQDTQQQQQTSSPSTTAISSFSNSNSVKKEREFEEVEVERGCYEDEEGSPRKKLRLTKEQSGVLEESFKEQSTLNPKQKLAIAEQLNLRPRQVEVWFQNRRARTKLKQTEVDCELLKKCCETLTEENKRLQKELQELKSLKTNDNTAPFYVQLPASTLTVCPSCERIAAGTAGGEASSKSTDFSIRPKPPHHLYNPFNHPYAAC
ncbi:homeobox-leucine zipper protein HAT22 isoform X3 [Tripterygium wilfordii]|uniref:Homeobox-leucine zipper protein HAT22 isoform X3 n=1 Tax=Tripterygium wilfordii TaxID=458696 RepID=A0A7J7D0L9_TRIWF|nr:homeobox-leucine zipper protein HAT22-like [Tripterygium wilfordii]KAF5739828.1 homeobox-leucine zipper protein HAT22 isoform X3 [Tripterygium wilfordii]